MPNYCDCELEIVGPPEDIATIRQQCNGDKPDGLVLDRLYPCPQELTELACGHWKMPDGSFAEVWRDTPDGPERVDEDELIRKYGYRDWHSWRVANWGTKWVNDLVVDEVDRSIYPDDDAGEVEITGKFETAWSPPTKFFLVISKRFPTCRIAVRHFEAGMSFQGYTMFNAGEIIEQYESKYYGSRGG